MRPYSSVLVCALLLLIGGAALVPGPAAGQGGWAWPETPENLTVLPGDTGGRRLRAVMTGFTRALGVRCSHCHVGEEGNPLSTYDFVSDDNPNKGTAREMMRMLGEINQRITALDPGEDAVRVTCGTCHAGRAVPRTLEDELHATLVTEGAEAVLPRYEALRERYYGHGAYDFGEHALNRMGYELLEEGAAAAAVDVFERNVENFPDSPNAHDSLAEAFLAVGEPQLAIRHYERALALDPDNENAAAHLRALRKD